MFDDLTLGQLFAEADRIGNQYQSDEEIDEVAQQLQAVWDELEDSGLLDD